MSKLLKVGSTGNQEESSIEDTSLVKTITLSGSTPQNVSTVTGELVLLLDATSGAITVNLPTAVGNTARITIKKVDSSSNTITVDPNSTETIDGQSTVTINFQNSAMTIVSDNTNWNKI